MAGWVAEDPELHLWPHLDRAIHAPNSPWRLIGRRVESDGVLVVELRHHVANRQSEKGSIRRDAFALLGSVAEGVTFVEESEGDRGMEFLAVTGMLADQTGFSPHGHTLRLVVRDWDGRIRVLRVRRQDDAGRQAAAARRAIAMKYILLIYADRNDPSIAPADPDDLATRYRAFTRSLADSGRLGPAEELQSPALAKSVRRRGGDLIVTDGPFAEVKEQLGGFYVIEAAGIDEAIEWAGRIPTVDVGTIEVRPIVGQAEAIEARALAITDAAVQAVERVFRDEQGRAVASLIRVLGDFDLAEEAVQDAFVVALERWPRAGIPRQPGRLDRHHGAQQGHRPAAARAASWPTRRACCASWWSSMPGRRVER